MTVLWIGLGGFLGANARYGLSRLLTERVGSGFPWGTLLVNITGALAIGIVLETLTLKEVGNPVYRLLIAVGFLGGYTTFSTYTFEAIALVEQDRWAQVAAYVIGSNVLALLACYLGMLAARELV